MFTLMKEAMFRRSPAAISALLALAALVGAGSANALVFTTSASVQDFRFDAQDLVLYTNPSLDQIKLELTPNNEVILTSIEGAGFSRTEGGEVVGTLNLGGSKSGTDFRGKYTIFGSLTPSEQASTLERMEGTLDAMQSAPHGQSLAFLFVDGPATGILGTQYQSVGIYTHVAGLDVEDWLRQSSLITGSSARLMEPTASGQGLAGASNVSIPATPLLLLAGLLGLRALRAAAPRRC
jgi:hypothetical protein